MASIRDVSMTVIHCSATPPDMDIGAKEIDRWHRQRGFLNCGYHYVICRDGLMELGRDVRKNGAHAYGYNTDSIGICMVGGVTQDDIEKPEDNFTVAQYLTLKNITLIIHGAYPNSTFCGHNHLSAAKACPSFHWKKFLEHLDLPITP